VGASAKKFALRHCGHRVSAKKFAQHTKNGPKWAFYAALGEFFAETPLEGPCRASFFADQQSCDPAGRVCFAVRLAAGPFCWHP
jgi:hypothetical protein